MRTPPPPWRAAAAAASAAARRPGLAQVAGVGETGRLADDHPDAGAPVAARRQVLDPAVVEAGGRAAPVLGEHLGELAAGAQGDAQDRLDHRFVDQRSLPLGRVCSALEQVEGTRLPLITVPVIVGVCGQAELVVSDADTAVGARHRRRAGAGHAPGGAALRGGIRGRPRRPCVGRGRPRSGSASSSPTWRPSRSGSTVIATATLERCEGRRLVFNTSVNDACGLVAAGRVTRVLVDTAAFLEKAR